MVNNKSLRIIIFVDSASWFIVSITIRVSKLGVVIKFILRFLSVLVIFALIRQNQIKPAVWWRKIKIKLVTLFVGNNHSLHIYNNCDEQVCTYNLER